MRLSTGSAECTIAFHDTVELIKQMCVRAPSLIADTSTCFDTKLKALSSCVQELKCKTEIL